MNVSLKHMSLLIISLGLVACSEAAPTSARGDSDDGEMGAGGQDSEPGTGGSGDVIHGPVEPGVAPDLLPEPESKPKPEPEVEPEVDEPLSAGPAHVDSIDTAVQFFNNSEREFSYTSNSAPHQQNAVLIADGNLYVVYFEKDGSLALARRSETENEDVWTKRQFPASHDQRDPDSHRTANIAMSPNDKRLHIMWGHHADPLRYIVTQDAGATLMSDSDFQISLFTAERQYLKAGQSLLKVCYPRLFVGADDKLQVVWRDDGGSGNANSYLATYNDDTTWSSRLKIADGKVGTYDGDGNRNAYFNDIGYREGVTHISWTWREDAKAQDGYVTNHDLHYAFSPDGGRTWKNRQGSVVGNTSDKTINLNSPVKFRTLDYKKRVENQTGQTIDRAGRVHMLFRHNNGSDQKKLFHYFKFKDRAEVHVRERAELASSIRPKIFADPTNHSDETLYVVTIAGGKVKVYAANRGDDFWGTWKTLYTSQASYLSATAQMAEDGRKLFILAQTRPADLNTAMSSELELISLPVTP